jgi:putative CocE/NonD family hydrolase
MMGCMFSARHKIIFRVVALGFPLLAAAVLARAQGAAYIREHYTKFDYDLPMRDGTRLFTSVYVPRAAPSPEPILLIRTPYSIRPYGEDEYPATLGPSEQFAKEGYIFVYQDVRGRFHSEGKFEEVRPYKAQKTGSRDTDESSDTWDTIDWLIKHIPNNNGKVGMWGISYPGFYVSEAMIDAHPALLAVSPQAPVGDWFMGDDWHHNGALFLAHAFRWFSANDRAGNDMTGRTPQRNFEYPTPDGYRLFLQTGTLPNINDELLKGSVEYWKVFRDHPNYDRFWQERNVPQYLKNVKPAVLTVSGWFDAEDMYGALATFRAVEADRHAPFNGLVMGPWVHGGWASSDGGSSLGAVQFGSKTADFYREQIEFPFFQHFLKGVSSGLPPKAYVFETGTNRWQTFDAWPPSSAQPKELYLREGGTLQFDAPPQEKSPAFDQYTSDPAHPVPYIGYVANTMTQEYMVSDQRFAATRADVLVYQTPPLTTDVTLAGPVGATLYVSTTGTDSDFVVKLVDVYPDDYADPSPNPANLRMGGYEQLVRGEPFRGKFRNSFSEPEPFIPGKLAKIEFTMPDIFHAFRRGHRIMVQIQSSWFPLVDRNPQTFCNIYQAEASQFQKADEKIYRYSTAASRLKVNVLPNP